MLTARKVMHTLMQRLLNPHLTKPKIAANRLLAKTRLLYALSLALLLGCVHYAQAEGNGRIVKWKDEKGVTHYGDTVPAQYLNQENTLINRQGVTVQRNKSVSGADKAAQLAQEQNKAEQAKKDKALLSAYTNAEEIDLALERNIQLDKITLENLQQEKLSHQNNLEAKQAMVASFQQRKKTAPPTLHSDIQLTQAKLDSVEEKISARISSIDATSKRFEADKQRYLLLKSPVIKTITP